MKTSVDEALAEARSAQKREPVTRALVRKIGLVKSGKKRPLRNLRELERRE